MTIFSVRHVTTYRYKRPVEFGEHKVFFRPRDSYDQRLLSSDIDVGPSPSVIRWKHVGPITDQILKDELEPLFAQVGVPEASR